MYARPLSGFRDRAAPRLNVLLRLYHRLHAAYAWREAAQLRKQRRQVERHLADLRGEVSRTEAHLRAIDGAIALNNADAGRSTLLAR